MKPLATRSALLFLVSLIPLTSATHAWQTDELPATHTGVASCASSLCHGSVTERPGSSILRNEYLTWQQQDAHSNAYQTLLGEQSQRMARRLGIGPAHQADICLDCHTDNVPPEQRGERFQLSDGVGCEACHGGAENWLASHTRKQASHADNVARGLMPLEKAEVRAEVCIACHVADDKRFAGHDIMGAGHPRLQFELMTYSVLQPYHHRIDDDYLERKPDTDGPLMLWAIGQLSTARRLLADLQSERFSSNGLWPELAYFDCHACHAPMGADKSERRRDLRADSPGSVRLNDSALTMLWALEQVLDNGQPDALLADIRALHEASEQSHAAIRDAAAKLDTRLATMAQRLRQQPPGSSEQQQLVHRISRMAGEGHFAGYLQAEQAAMAVQAMLSDLDGSLISHNRQLDRVFNALRDPDTLETDNFRRAMQALAESLRGD